MGVTEAYKKVLKEIPFCIQVKAIQALEKINNSTKCDITRHNADIIMSGQCSNCGSNKEKY